MDVERDEAGGPASGDGDVGEGPRESEGRRHVTLVLHALRRSGREEREDQSERRYEQFWQSVYHRKLLEDHCRGTERCQERHVLTADPLCVRNEYIGKPVVEFSKKTEIQALVMNMNGFVSSRKFEKKIGRFE